MILSTRWYNSERLLWTFFLRTKWTVWVFQNCTHVFLIYLGLEKTYGKGKMLFHHSTGHLSKFCFESFDSSCFQLIWNFGHVHNFIPFFNQLSMSLGWLLCLTYKTDNIYFYMLFLCEKRFSPRLLAQLSCKLNPKSRWSPGPIEQSSLLLIGYWEPLLEN